MGIPTTTPIDKPDPAENAAAKPSALPYATGESLPYQVGTLSYTRSGLRMLFFWLLWGDFTLMMRERSVLPTFQLMLKQFHASDFLLGILVGFIPHAVAMVLNPIISYRSDRHRSLRGRRIPYLLLTTPLCFVGMVGLAFSPQIGAWAHPTIAWAWNAISGRSMSVNGSVLIMIGLSWTLFEICAIATVTIYNALVADVVPRNVIGRFFGLFRTISLADGIFFMLVLIRFAERYYAWIFCGVGALFAVSFTLMCFMVKEGEYPPPEQAADGKPRTVFAATGVYMRECFSHSYYRWFAASVALALMAFVPINTYSVWFSKSLGMDPKMYGYYSAIQFFLSLIQAYPIGWLADKFHPLRLVIISFFLHATTVTLAFFLVRGPVSFGVFHVLTGTCAGFWLTAYQPMLPALLPRVRYATLASAIAVATGIGTMVIGPACGLFLDHVVNHDYRYVYVWALGLDALAFGATMVVWGKFMTFGGPRAYVAPE